MKDCLSRRILRAPVATFVGHFDADGNRQLLNPVRRDPLPQRNIWPRFNRQRGFDHSKQLALRVETAIDELRGRRLDPLTGF